MLPRLACPRGMTSLRKPVVCLDLNGGGSWSRRGCVPNHDILVDEFLDESARTVLPLGVEDDVFLLVEVYMLVLRESKGAGAEEGGNED